MKNLNTLTDPQSFISHYYNELKSQLESDDLSISKVGVIGYLLHIFGNLQYDIKSYYDGMFKEAFPITAVNDINLQQHAITFGFNYDSGSSAVLTGTIYFDFLNLPSRSIDTIRREIDLQNISFTVDGLNFILETNYKLIIDIIDFTEYYKARLISKTGEYQMLSMSSQYPTIPINGCRQISSETTYFNIPSYPYNSYYIIEINLLDVDMFIESIEVLVKEYNSDTFVSYDTSRIKTFYTPTDMVVFYKTIYRNNEPILIIELGSGKKGKYIPNSEIQVILHKTKGVLGNIGNISISKNISGYVQIIDYDINGQVLYTLANSITPDQFIKFNIEKGSGGSNALFGDELRKALIKFIQSRNNLLNELDFKNILTKYFSHVEFLFKKTYFQDNTMNVYVSMMNRYNLPAPTLSKTIDESIFINSQSILDNVKYNFYPEITIDGSTFLSPFLYEYNEFLKLYKGYLILTDQTFNLNSLLKINSAYTQTEPMIKLQVIFDYQTLTFNFKILPIIDSISFKYKLKIPTLNIDSFVDDTTKTYTYSGIIINKLTVYVYVYDNQNNQLYEIKFNSVGLIENTEQFIQLKSLPYLNNNILIDVPLISKTEFLLDESFYLGRLITQVQTTNLSEVQLVTDNIQLKFINSYYIPQTYNKKLTIQAYDFSLYLPLRVSISLILETQYIINNTTDINSSINNLKLAIASYLSNRIDTTIKFYGSQLIDFIHSNNPWIKSVTLTLIDNRDFEIPLSNIETIDQKLFISKNSKIEILEYCPFLWWFDINNINIQYNFLGD